MDSREKKPRSGTAGRQKKTTKKTKTFSAGFRGVREPRHGKAWWLGRAALRQPAVSVHRWALNTRGSVYPPGVGDGEFTNVSGKIDSLSSLVLAQVKVFHFLPAHISWIYLCVRFVFLSSNAAVEASPLNSLSISAPGEEVHGDSTSQRVVWTRQHVACAKPQASQCTEQLCQWSWCRFIQSMYAHAGELTLLSKAYCKNVIFEKWHK